MFALVESGSITKFLNDSKGITIDGVQTRTIFNFGQKQREMLRYLCVEMDYSIKDEEWYTIQITYSFGSGRRFLR